MSRISFTTNIIVTLTICITVAIVCSHVRCTREFSPPMQVTIQPFCTILPTNFKFIRRHPKLPWAGQEELYWDKGTTLKIYFSGNSPELERKVLAIAKVWTDSSRIKFEQVYSESEDPQIRISFHCRGYNSLVGKQNLDPVYRARPTMCLEGFDKLKDEAVFQRTVLHEFGHVMGLFHELQSPEAKIPWDTLKLYHYYDSVYRWKPDSVNKWVLRLYDKVEHSEFDKESIMLYEVPASVTKGGFSISWPNKLSNLDKEFIYKKYH